MPEPVQARAVAATLRFGAFTAVDRVDLQVAAGEVVGLLGANGAGKTSLIRLLLGLLRPTAGRVELFGSAPSVGTRRRVGYVPQSLGLYDDLTVAENWRFTAAAFGSSQTMPATVSAVGDRLVGALPLGTQRRVAFAVALAHRPELLVLDEPTSGVGPLQRARLWEEIRGAAERGAGVLVTTHNMEEAEECDRLVVMVDGSVAVQGRLADVVGGRLVAEVQASDRDRAFRAVEAAGLAVEIHGERLRVAAPGDDVARLLARSGVDATCREVPAHLDEAFVQIVTKAGL